MTIYFYSHNENEPYGSFSNFSNHGFKINGEVWKTSEHYFQAQKFVYSPKHYNQVMESNHPKKAAQIGRDRSLPLRPDWNSVKENVMRQALEAKFTQHEKLKDLLLSTGNQEIVEDSPIDFYWGCGSDRTGQNRLGILLMELRDKLRK